MAAGHRALVAATENSSLLTNYVAARTQHSSSDRPINSHNSRLSSAWSPPRPPLLLP